MQARKYVWFIPPLFFPPATYSFHCHGHTCQWTLLYREQSILPLTYPPTISIANTVIHFSGNRGYFPSDRSPSREIHQLHLHSHVNVIWPKGIVHIYQADAWISPSMRS